MVSNTRESQQKAQFIYEPKQFLNANYQASDCSYDSNKKGKKMGKEKRKMRNPLFLIKVFHFL